MLASRRNKKAELICEVNNNVNQTEVSIPQSKSNINVFKYSFKLYKCFTSKVWRTYDSLPLVVQLLRSYCHQSVAPWHVTLVDIWRLQMLMSHLCVASFPQQTENRTFCLVLQRLIALTTITWLHCLGLLLRVLVVLGLNVMLKLIRPSSSSSSSCSYPIDTVEWVHVVLCQSQATIVVFILLLSCMWPYVQWYGQLVNHIFSVSPTQYATSFMECMESPRKWCKNTNL